MSKYDYVNGKWTFRATPLDYLHCIFNEYEWLLLLKGRNKPYESILDPLHERLPERNVMKRGTCRHKSYNEMVMRVP